ncbi:MULTISPECIES: hypothetical protein [Streptomyces]|uniref:Uncharacterized protein n=1 Tax=Streptomyces xanthii TaxID=2768069 RepID=A0A7H1B138_9ACTN|nr:hypothetical protein [Streptomyces xanthii]QNS02443.1 hypothetical protein IAG42_01645 [Streptomyces xanthii]
MQTITTHPDDLLTYDAPTAGDWLLPPPNPADRLPCHVDPRDLRRLDLHALLTAAGVAPSPGDTEAIERLSALPDSVHHALRRWLGTCGRCGSTT